MCKRVCLCDRISTLMHLCVFSTVVENFHLHNCQVTKLFLREIWRALEADKNIVTRIFLTQKFANEIQRSPEENLRHDSRT